MYNRDADNCGRIPEVDDFVAYNYSGQIATGWITYKGRTKRGWPTSTFTIKQLHPTDGHVSRIRGGAKCVLVLERANTRGLPLE